MYFSFSISKLADWASEYEVWPSFDWKRWKKWIHSPDDMIEYWIQLKNMYNKIICYNFIALTKNVWHIQCSCASIRNTSKANSKRSLFQMSWFILFDTNGIGLIINIFNVISSSSSCAYASTTCPIAWHLNKSPIVTKTTLFDRHCQRRQKWNGEESARKKERQRDSNEIKIKSSSSVQIVRNLVCKTGIFHIAGISMRTKKNNNKRRTMDKEKRKKKIVWT